MNNVIIRLPDDEALKGEKSSKYVEGLASERVIITEMKRKIEKYIRMLRC